MIKAIFLDFEGVITEDPFFLFTSFYERVKSAITFEDFEERYRSAKIGKINYAKFTSGLPVDEKNLLEGLKFRKGAKEFLEENYKKTPLFLASNHIDYLSKKEVEGLGIRKYFKKIFFSFEMGAAKPQKEFFEKIIADSGLKLKKDEMVFVDDAEINLEGAKKAGFITICADNGRADDRRRTTSYKADYTITNIGELCGLIKKL